jgi:Ligand-gated ion channel
LWDTGLAHKC